MNVNAHFYWFKLHFKLLILQNILYSIMVKFSLKSISNQLQDKGNKHFFFRRRKNIPPEFFAIYCQIFDGESLANRIAVHVDFVKQPFPELAARGFGAFVLDRDVLLPA